MVEYHKEKVNLFGYPTFYFLTEVVILFVDDQVIKTVVSLRGDQTNQILSMKSNTFVLSNLKVFNNSTKTLNNYSLFLSKDYT